MFDAISFRALFPVLGKLTYLNAGTDGPMPSACASAMQKRLDVELNSGRSGGAYFDELAARWGSLRAKLAGLIGCSSDELALTRSTTDGINAVLRGYRFKPGDEVVTSDEEHPGLLAPLAAVARERSLKVKIVPLKDVAQAVGPSTAMVACSHVSWISGALAPVDELAQAGVPVLYDGAQALGAIEVDVKALACDFYAAPGQKWLCGPDSTGALYVNADWIERLSLAWPHFGSLADTMEPMKLEPRPAASRFDSGFLPGALAEGLLASLNLFEEVSWRHIFATAFQQSERLRTEIDGHFKLASTDPTTLVSWDMERSHEAVEKLFERGAIVREIPGRSLVRASVGAWTVDYDLDRLMEEIKKLK